MTWFGIYALAILALPIVLVLRWIITDWLKTRRRARAQADAAPWSPAAIAARVEHERGTQFPIFQAGKENSPRHALHRG